MGAMSRHVLGAANPRLPPLPFTPQHDTDAHLTSSFTRGASQAGGAHGAGRTALARRTRGTLLAGFALRKAEHTGMRRTPGSISPLGGPHR